MNNIKKRVLSLGLGVQSTALYYMSSKGELPRVDYAIFSDPGKEKKKTYAYLEFLQNWAAKNNGIPILIRKDKNLYKDLLEGTNSTSNRFASIPAFTEKDGEVGILRRQCTKEYKIDIVIKAIREQYELPARKRMPLTEIWQGITLDEVTRCSLPFNNQLIYVYPFVGYQTSKKNKAQKLDETMTKPMDRNNVIHWYKRNNLPVPPRSACIFCPFQTDHEWNLLKEDQTEFDEAKKVDQSIRNSSKRGIIQPIYLHRSLIPIDEIDFSKVEETTMLFNENECSGFCRV